MHAYYNNLGLKAFTDVWIVIKHVEKWDVYSLICLQMAFSDEHSNSGSLWGSLLREFYGGFFSWFFGFWMQPTATLDSKSDKQTKRQ